MDQAKIRTVIRSRLQGLSKLRARTDETDRRLQEAAQKELERVNRDLDKLRPRVHLDEAAADRYQALILDRARLERILR